MGSGEETTGSEQISATNVISIRVPDWERWTVYAILTLYLAVQLNNIHNLAFIGQDFDIHAACTEGIILEPTRWFQLDSTNRPLLYWIGSACKRFTHDRYTYELASIVCVLFSALSLVLIHASSLLIIKTPLFRLSSLIFLTFLPLTLITSVVYAADTAALLPFSLLIFAVSRVAAETSVGRILVFAGLAAAALCVGILSKATFALLPAGMALLCVIFWRVKLYPLRTAAVVGVLVALVPLVFAVLLQIRVYRELAGAPSRHSFNWHGTGEMTWRSLLFPYYSDYRILDAPAYWEVGVNESGIRVRPLLTNNSYSYPALLALGTFTDVLDYARQGALDNGALRPDDHQRFATMAVWLGLGVFLIMLGAIAFGVVRLCLAIWTGSTGSVISLIWVVAALNWALPVLITLPFVEGAYQLGYWLPRLILPAIWSAGVLLFVTLETWLKGRSSSIRVLVLLLIIIEAVVHVKSVWY